MTDDNEFKIEKFKADASHELELMRATIQFEHAAMRPAYLLNGGALIASLTYLGHRHDLTMWAIIVAVALWLFGLLSAGLATQFGYKSQWSFLKAYRQKIDGNDAGKLQFSQNGHCHRSKWSVCIFASLACFGAGSVFALVSFFA